MWKNLSWGNFWTKKHHVILHHDQLVKRKRNYLRYKHKKYLVTPRSFAKINRLNTRTKIYQTKLRIEQAKHFKTPCRSAALRITPWSGITAVPPKNNYTTNEESHSPKSQNQITLINRIDHILPPLSKILNKIEPAVEPSIDYQHFPL